MVKGDNGQLQQAFVNLILNALEAMGPNGTLSVATEFIPQGSGSGGAEGSERPQVRVAIKDSGLGIQPKHLKRLFEPFFTTKDNGTGLGLPITRHIIQEHHGFIGVESQPGTGTAFQILLPASP